ncbi:hypothetical protein JXQ70_09140 [bacterium]|nr:hypothetical protein [bacterium]
MPKSAHMVLFLLLLLTLSGCLTVGKLAVTIIWTEKDINPLLHLDYFDISSSAATAEEVRQDYQTLIDQVKGEEYVQERASEGLIVLERKLEIVAGKINGHEKVTIKDLAFLSDKLKLISTENERRLVLDQDEEELVETNARVVQENENTVLIWPVSEKKLFYTIRLKDNPAAVDQNRSEMLRLVQAYLNPQQKPGSDHDLTKTP